MCIHVGAMSVLPPLGYEAPKGSKEKQQFGYQACGTRLGIQLVVGSDSPKISPRCILMSA